MILDENIKLWRWSDGTLEYHNRESKIHREDGPAIIRPDGQEQFWRNGKLHREDGPAITYSDGSQYWYLSNNNITSEVKIWLKENNITYPFTECECVLFKLRFC